jgi:hypothetical protein
VRLAAGVQRCDGRNVIPAGIFVRVLRPAMLHGAPLAVGEHLLTATEAMMLIDSSRAELVNRRDAAALEEARRREVAQTLRELRTPHPLPEAGPWRAIGS